MSRGDPPFPICQYASESLAGSPVLSAHQHSRAQGIRLLPDVSIKLQGWMCEHQRADRLCSCLWRGGGADEPRCTLQSPSLWTPCAGVQCLATGGRLQCRTVSCRHAAKWSCAWYFDWSEEKAVPEPCCLLSQPCCLPASHSSSPAPLPVWSLLRCWWPRKPQPSPLCGLQEACSHSWGWGLCLGCHSLGHSLISMQPSCTSAPCLASSCKGMSPSTHLPLLGGQAGQGTAGEERQERREERTPLFGHTGGDYGVGRVLRSVPSPGGSC